MASNTSPINTQTKVKKIKIDKNLAKNISGGADIMGAKGYLLRSSFTLDDKVILIFQRTR
ncbi:MAG: hypothetical protein V3W41_01830 [Planctomycetota bacterium]